MATRDLWTGVILLLFAIGIFATLPVYSFSATYSAEHVSRADVADTDQYVPADTLDPGCRRIAATLAGGDTVLERGYWTPILDGKMAVTRTNRSGGWQRGDSICVSRFTVQGEGFRLDGQYYAVNLSSIRERRVPWLGLIGALVGLAGGYLGYRGVETVLQD